MPTLELDEMELVEAARGARCLCNQAEAELARRDNPALRRLYERNIQFCKALAEKLERARKSALTRQKSDLPR
jgi:hypothetical protein